MNVSPRLMASTRSSDNLTAALSNLMATTEKHPFQPCFHLTKEIFETVDSISPYIVNCALNVPSSVTAIIANAMVLSAIWKVTSLTMPSKILLFNLALTDLAIGLIVQPLFMTALISKIRRLPGTFCSSSIAYIVVSSCMSIVSLLTVAAISLDRYIALYLHLRYAELVTARRVVLVLCGIWCTSVLGGTTWLWDHQIFDPLAVSCSALFIILVTSFAYFKVYQVVRRHQIQIQVQMNIQARILAQEETLPQSNTASNSAQRRKSATTMLLLYCLLFGCILPYIVCELVIQVNGLNTTRELVREFTFTLVSLNSSLNPIVYCWRLREIRDTVDNIIQNILQTFGLKRRTSYGIAPRVPAVATRSRIAAV